MESKNHIFCMQHLLPSVIGMIEDMSDVFPGYRVNVYGKEYSTIPFVSELVAEKFRLSERSRPDSQSLSRRISKSQSSLILDEGGILQDLIRPIPYNHVAGVEQTSSGMRERWKYPTVLVCRSAAKLTFESQIIARGLLRKLESLGVLKNATVGVIGLGALGAEIARCLIERGYSIVVYDRMQPRGMFAPFFVPLAELLASTTLILGVTGTDCLDGIPLDTLPSRVTFASCSSSNVEFRAVLRWLTRNGEFGTASGSVGSSFVSVLNGGYPVNFDRETEWENPEEIWLTRELCLAGLIQAESLVSGTPRGVMLDPSVQARLVYEWLDRVPEPEALRVPPNLDVDYFRTRSEGEHEMSKKPVYKLHSTTPTALEKMRSHTDPYEVEVQGMSILVLPDVWSPMYDWSSTFYIENFPDVDGLSFLEIGSGTGVISVYAGLQGATRVVAVDVNPEAVRNTRLNFERHGLGAAEAILSDGFDQVNGRFDVVTWNAPYHGNRPNDPLERGCSDEDYKGIRAFFRGVGERLMPGGSVVFGFSESGDLSLIRDLIMESGYRVKREFSDWRQDYNCMLFELVRSGATHASS